MNWFQIVTDSDIPGDYSKLPEALEFFDKEYIKAKEEIRIRGRIEKNSVEHAVNVENRFSQLQELEALIEWINDEYKRVRQKSYKKYLEAYNTALSSRDASLYAEADDDVLAISALRNQIALTRNKFIGIVKGLEAKGYQINNICKLREAGLDDTEIKY